ncbi:hypothetical protein ACQX25_10800 [Corynebacterium diphtheriae]|nr:hypothetical protein [Corynebacterium diphtheriae]
MLLEYASDESGAYSKVVDAGIDDPQAVLGYAEAAGHYDLS